MHRHLGELRGSDDELVGPGLGRVDPDRRQDVPRRHRPQVVVAGQAGRAVGEERRRGPDDIGGLPRLAGPQVDVGSVQVGLVLGVVSALPVVVVGAVDPHLAGDASRVGEQLVVVEEVVEPSDGLLLTTDSLDQAGQVLGHKPLVLPCRALVEALGQSGIGVAGEDTVGVAGPRELRRRVDERAPVARPEHVALGVVGLAERIGEPGERAVRHGILHRRRPTVGEVEVTGLARCPCGVGHVAVGDVRRVADASVRRVAGRWHLVGVLFEQGIGLPLVAGQEAVLPRRDKERGHGITGHDVRLDGSVGPPRRPPTLLPGTEQRDRLVAGLTGRKQSQELDLGPVRVPQREVLVVRRPVRSVGPSVPPVVAAVDVAARARCDEAAVERGVERSPVCRWSPCRLDQAEPCHPRVASGRQHAVERPISFCDKIVPRTGGVDVGQRGYRGDVAVGRCVEPDPGTAPATAGRLGRACGERRAGPGARRGERPVKAGDEMQSVGPRRLAEPLPRHRRLDGVVVDDLRIGARHGVKSLPGVDEDRRVRRRGEGVALPTGARRRRELRLDRAGRRGEGHLVGTRARLLRVMGKRQRVCRVVG